MGKTQDKGLETLRIWQRSLEFAELICTEILPRLPSEEKWALAAQFLDLGCQALVSFFR